MHSIPAAGTVLMHTRRAELSTDGRKLYVSVGVPRWTGAPDAFPRAGIYRYGFEGNGSGAITQEAGPVVPDSREFMHGHLFMLRAALLPPAERSGPDYLLVTTMDSPVAACTLYKLRLPGMETVASVVLQPASVPAGQASCSQALEVPLQADGTYGEFVYATWVRRDATYNGSEPGELVRVRLADLAVAARAPLPGPSPFVGAMALDPSGRYLVAFLYYAPVRTITFRLADLALLGPEASYLFPSASIGVKQAARAGGLLVAAVLDALHFLAVRDDGAVVAAAPAARLASPSGEPEITVQIAEAVDEATALTCPAARAALRASLYNSSFVVLSFGSQSAGGALRLYNGETGLTAPRYLDLSGVSPVVLASNSRPQILRLALLPPAARPPRPGAAPEALLPVLAMGQTDQTGTGYLFLRTFALVGAPPPPAPGPDAGGGPPLVAIVTPAAVAAAAVLVAAVVAVVRAWRRRRAAAASERAGAANKEGWSWRGGSSSESASRIPSSAVAPAPGGSRSSGSGTPAQSAPSSTPAPPRSWPTPDAVGPLTGGDPQWPTGELPPGGATTSWLAPLRVAGGGGAEETSAALAAAAAAEAAEAEGPAAVFPPPPEELRAAIATACRFLGAGGFGRVFEVRVSREGVRTLAPDEADAEWAPEPLAVRSSPHRPDSPHALPSVPPTAPPLALSAVSIGALRTGARAAPAVIPPPPGPPGGGLEGPWAGEGAGPGERVALAVKEIVAGSGEAFQREAKGALLQASCRHPNVLPVLSAWQSQAFLYIVMPRAATSLDRYIAAVGRLPTAGQLVEFATQIARGMRYLHEEHAPPIAHRDLKPANVLIFPRRGGAGEAAGVALRLADFGVARNAFTITSVIGTRIYMPPECTRRYDPLLADRWAYGLTVVEMATGVRPYGGACDEGVLLAGRPYPPAVLAGLPERVRECAVRCLALDPAARPSFSEVLRILEPPSAAAEQLQPAEPA